MSRWLRRVAVLLGCWLVTIALLTWVQAEPSWLGLLAALTALAAIGWLISDASRDLAQSDWYGWHAHRPADRPSLDGRLGVLRRLVATAGERPPGGADTRPAAAELQQLLGAITEQRLRTRGGAPRPLPTDLAAYLDATPAPLVPPDRLDHLLTRIEAL